MYITYFKIKMPKSNLHMDLKTLIIKLDDRLIYTNVKNNSLDKWPLNHICI